MRFHRQLARLLVLVAVSACLPAAWGQRPEVTKPAPDRKDVAYGPHERNVLDLWQAKSEKPTPLVVYIHGGGFRAGSKESLNARTLRELLDAGISVAALNYRFVTHAPLPAAHHDCRRALQFLRSKAGAWDLDKTRVGAFGGSAGAQLCMYLAFHDDMADRESDDPVARESTRLTCVATNGGQTTMDVAWWKKHVPGYDAPHRSFFETFGVETKEAYLKQVADVSALSLISKDDVPIFMTYGMKPDDPAPDDARRAQGWKVHHVVFGIHLKEKMDALGLEADLQYPGARTKYRSVSHFFIDKLTGDKKDAEGARRPRRTAPQPRPGRRGPAPVPEGVTFTPNVAYRKGNEKWRLDLAMPTERGEALRPAIVFVHGGGWRGGDKGGGPWRSLPLNYAAKGYVCVSVNYRLTGEAPFPACVEDVKCAVRWLRAHAREYHVDPERIGAYGNSAGAHLVAMLGLVGPEAKLEGDGPHPDQSSLVQAVCCSATPADFADWGGRRDNTFLKRGLLKGPEETFAERAQKASPVTHAKADAPPFLVIHGTEDRTVPVSHGDRLVEALKKAGAKDVTYLRYEGAGHGVFGQQSAETHPAMAKFFARTIGAERGKAAPSPREPGKRE